MQDEKIQSPHLRVEQASANRSSIADGWKIVWSIENSGEQPLHILGGRLPHSQFRCEEQELPRALELPPKGRAEVEFPVTCKLAPGSTIENAFLILRILWSEKPWRVLARLRVHLDGHGRPRCATEVITAHQIGFSARGEPSHAAANRSDSNANE